MIVQTKGKIEYKGSTIFFLKAEKKELYFAHIVGKKLIEFQARTMEMVQGLATSHIDRVIQKETEKIRKEAKPLHAWLRK